MIYLITGAIGTGKTTYVVDQLMQLHKENEKLIKDGKPEKVRKIFSNIDGLAVPHEPLPDDWRDTPENSILAIDECHKIDIYKPDRKQLHSDPRIVALNESRHTGHDLYFITQAPKFLHSHVRGLCNKHYHFHNPMGLAASTVFVWRHGNTLSPDNAAAKNIAEDTFIYNFKKDVQQNFKSIEDDAQHTRKIKIPKKVIFWLSLPILCLCVIAYLFTKPSTKGALDGSYYKTSNTTEAINKATQALPHQQQKPVVYDSLTPEQRADLEKRAQQNPATTGQTAQTQQTNTTTISYNVNKPFDVDNSNFQRSVVNYPEFAGCAEFNKTCTCYTQQGTLLKVEAKICQQGLRERPFNYFRQEQQQQVQFAQTSPVSQSAFPETHNPMQTGKFS